MAKAITSEKIFIPEARLSFPVIDKPKQYIGEDGKPQGEPKFSFTLLLDPSNKLHVPVIAKIKSEAGRIAKEFFDPIPKAFSQPGCKTLCYGLGNDLDKVYDGYADMFYVKLSSNSRIPVVGRRKDAKTGKFTQLQAGDAEWPYAGCFVNATMTMWTQDSHGRKAINGNAIGLQFVRDGEAFGGGAPANPDAEFEALEDSAETGTDPFG